MELFFIAKGSYYIPSWHVLCYLGCILHTMQNALIRLHWSKCKRWSFMLRKKIWNESTFFMTFSRHSSDRNMVSTRFWTFELILKTKRDLHFQIRDREKHHDDKVEVFTYKSLTGTKKKDDFARRICNELCNLKLWLTFMKLAAQRLLSGFAIFDVTPNFSSMWRSRFWSEKRRKNISNMAIFCKPMCTFFFLL